MKLQLSIFVLILFFISCNNSRKEDRENKNTENNNLSESKQNLINEFPEFLIDTFIDERDNKKYSTIKIGNQIWTKSVIQYKTNKGHIYGDYLYDWDAAASACPKSFKIPSEKDWSDLFQYVYDSIIIKTSPHLIEKLSNGEIFTCKECQEKFRNAGLPYQFRLDTVLAKFGKYDFKDIINNRDYKMVVMFLYLEQIGFCTSGSGFKSNGGLGADDYSYFWTSTSDSSGDHKYIPIYTGDYCRGCGYKFSMPFNDKFGFNLKCIKTN
jgi:hypothetical protein